MTMLLSPVSKSKSGAWKKKRVYRSFILFFLKHYTIYFPILSVMQASFSRRLVEITFRHSIYACWLALYRIRTRMSMAERKSLETWINFDKTSFQVSLSARNS